MLCEKLPHILGIANGLAEALAPLGAEIFELPMTTGGEGAVKPRSGYDQKTVPSTTEHSRSTFNS